jgi:hypothetical protein
MNNACTSHNLLEFIPKCLLVIGYNKEDVRLKISVVHLNKLLDDCYTIVYEAMRVDKVHAGKFVVKMGRKPSGDYLTRW